LELGLTYGAAYIGGFFLFFNSPFSGGIMLADLVIHPLLTLVILAIGFSLLTIAGWDSSAILTCQFMLLLPITPIIAFFGAFKGGSEGWDAYLAAGNVDSGNIGAIAVAVFSWFGIPLIAMISHGWSGSVAWKRVKQSRQPSSSRLFAPTKSLLQATTIALLGNGLTRFRGADLTGTNFTDANLQDTEF
jgi:hypothetical protein